MCGIVGLLYFDRARAVEESLVEQMRLAAAQRGPDDHGLYVCGNVGLGLNRLSIIDLSGGHQPMSNEDGSVWIVFNGEIYNFAELRQQLIGGGHRFQTQSDTETIVHAWEEYGERCVDKLRGMFAFVIWDARQHLLFAARDRLGIKPFYYYADCEKFCFASEVKSLLQVPSVKREVDPAALSQFLRHRYVIAPHTMLRGIKKLPPAQTLLVQESRVKTRRYWEIPTGEVHGVDEQDARSELGTYLDDAVRSHLVSDVPLGVFLSGGLDSSSVVASMSKLGVPRIQTFSIGYHSAESELDYARLVAAHFQTDHHEVVLTPEAFRDVLPQIVWYMDEPVGDEACIPLHYLSRFARRQVKVVLSGEGSDEIFGGYAIYKRMLGFESWNRLPGASLAGKLLSRCLPDGKLKRYAGMLGRPLESRYGGVSVVFSAEQTRRLCPAVADVRSDLNGTDDAYRRCHNLGPLARMCYVDLNTWLADDLLLKADRMSMANSLELRVPFLDHKLVEFTAQLPAQLKMKRGTGKYLLKKYMRPLLPRKVIQRPKQGFPVPTKSWFRKHLAAFTRDTFLSSDGATADFFSRREIERLLASHQLRDLSHQIYPLLVFDQWYRLFVKRSPRAFQQLSS